MKSNMIKGITFIAVLFLLASFLILDNTAYAEPKTPVEVVMAFIAGYGNANMDDAADFTTAKIRGNKPKSVWVVETWKALNEIEYSHKPSKVIEAKVKDDKAVVLVDAEITTAAGDSKQVEIFVLVKDGDNWLIDDLVVADEKVDLDESEL